MQKRIFKATIGSNIKRDRIQEYGEFLWKLKEENGEVLKTSFVVEKAKPKSSPIHDFFEWDDKIAGHKYREWQARYLLSQIEIVEVVDGAEERIKAFHNISIANSDDKTKERGYVTLADVRENQNYLDIVLENAKNEIISWEKRYSQYKKLKKFRPLMPLFRAVAQVNA
jgi:hypothetical protein